MNMAIVHVAVVALAVAVSAQTRSQNDRGAKILRYESENTGVDDYSYAIETSNGIAHQEQGQLVNAGSDRETFSVRGSYRYTGPDGVVYQVNYIADENGFRPQGAHLPLGPA